MSFITVPLSFSLQISFDFASLTKAHNTAIESMAYDPRHKRLASTGGGCLKVWDVDSDGSSVPHCLA
jgi:hypothetical protein